MARLAAFDMDGTLLMPDHHLGEKTLSTLARLRERDITLTFATGRHALEMQHILGALSLDAYLITGNGTRVHSLEGELLHRDDLPADVAELVLYQQWDTRASMHIFNDDGWFTGKEIPALLQAFVYSGFRYQIIDVKKMPLGSVTKICFCGDHDDLTRLQIQLYEALGERAHLCFSATDCLEVLPVGCNKGAALTVLTQHLGLSLRDCMAFGDAMNDREMLVSVGSGFIMGNAMPQLRGAPAFTGDWTLPKSGCLSLFDALAGLSTSTLFPRITRSLPAPGNCPVFFALNLSFCAVVFKPHRINCRDFTFKIKLKEKKILCGRAMLDKIDRKLLALLQQDCTLSLQALAEAVNLTTTPCWKRLKRLEDDGILIGKVALLDPEKIGLGLTAFVLIKTQHHSSEWYCRFVTVVTEMPEVLGFWRMAGEYDYLMRVQVADMKRYDEFYKRLVNSVPGLSDVTSSFAMEQIKYTTSLPIE